MFRNLRIRILNLFRISDFGFRICFSRGFTAIELMIVLAIMGIMLVAAAPSFVQFTRNSRIKSGAQIVVSALRTARSHAIKRRKRCAVLFNMDADNVGYAVKIYWDPDGYVKGGSETNWKTLPKTIIMAERATTPLSKYNVTTDDVPFPHDTSNAYPDIKYIIFKPTGAASFSGATKRIDVSDINRNDTSYIEITGITGRIKTSRTQ